MVPLPRVVPLTFLPRVPLVRSWGSSCASLSRVSVCSCHWACGRILWAWCASGGWPSRVVPWRGSGHRGGSILPARSQSLSPSSVGENQSKKTREKKEQAKQEEPAHETAITLLPARRAKGAAATRGGTRGGWQRQSARLAAAVDRGVKNSAGQVASLARRTGEERGGQRGGKGEQRGGGGYSEGTGGTARGLTAQRGGGTHSEKEKKRGGGGGEKTVWCPRGTRGTRERPAGFLDSVANQDGTSERWDGGLGFHCIQGHANKSGRSPPLEKGAK